MRYYKRFVCWILRRLGDGLVRLARVLDSGLHEKEPWPISYTKPGEPTGGQPEYGEIAP